MTNIPEPTLVQIRRFLARGMPLEEIAFLTRIEPEVIEEEIKQRDEELGAMPGEHRAMIRKLGRENMPVGRIAFMTHMSESTVHEILAIAGIEPTKNPAEEQGSSR
jgi:DNA-binding transcriptional MerR regulator